MADLAVSNRWAHALNTMSAKADKLQKRIKEIKVEAPTRRLVHASLASVGGAAHGVLQKQMPSFQIGDVTVPTGLAIGGAVLGLAVSGTAGEYSDQLASFAAGMLACETSKAVQGAL